MNGRDKDMTPVWATSVTGLNGLASIGIDSGSYICFGLYEIANVEGWK